MKRIGTISAILLLTAAVAINAQARDSKAAGKPSLGFNVSQYQNDFGIGVHFLTPYFFNNSFAVKIGGNVQWLQYSNPDARWTPYWNLQLGFRGREFIVEDKISIYGEGGLVILLPNSEFSSRSFQAGGYGLFGFEFMTASGLSYFIEMGGIGTGASADKVPGRPIYSNGLMTNVGFRYAF